MAHVTKAPKRSRCTVEINDLEPQTYIIQTIITLILNPGCTPHIGIKICLGQY